MRDLLYFDLEKAASIASQLGGGLRERFSVTHDIGKDTSAGVRFGLPHLADAKLGVDYAEKRLTLESRVLHHDLLTEVEIGLEKLNLVADLIKNPPGETSSPASIRDAIGTRPYLRASGRSVIEDYRRIVAISGKFNEIVNFISRGTLETLKKSPEYLELREQLEAAKKTVAEITDRNSKARAKAQLRSREEALEVKLKPQLEGIPEWLVDGLKLWIETFMPTRINFRIYPFPDCPSFQVICNLKREGFVDADLEHLLYGYGNKPTVPLAVFGLITSLPPQEDQAFDPLREFQAEGGLPDRAAFEKGLRTIFSAMDEIEAFVRFSRYPNVTLHPIAVYRSFADAD